MKKLLPVFISVFVIVSNMLCAYASENVLRSVEVKNSGADYKIEFTSTEPAPVSKTILSANRILINIKDISLLPNVSTKFNGNMVFDNVIVEPYGNNSANVYIQGDNIAYANIEFKEPSIIEKTEDDIINSFKSLFSIISGSSMKDRGIQFGLLGILLCIILGEIRFIKSKYDELKLERKLMYQDIEATRDFQEYLSGYGRAGLNKPYTTPVYSTNPVVNQNATKPYKLKTPETITLNSLLYNRNKEEKIINRIVNNTVPVFGSLSNIETTTNPVQKSKIKSTVSHLEKFTEKIKSTPSLTKRFNRVY